ncbi:hypothetical protein R3P38DRAFT_2802785 [Favolaschia claudopus]|uniref:Uncharacterized protein n=1 Tax=Favolaschia claudopus TaxID=2862362 RepID=A0AAV9ZTJ0_9AGAR
MSYPNNSPLIAAYMTQHSLSRPLPDVPNVAPAATITSVPPIDGPGYVLPVIPSSSRHPRYAPPAAPVFLAARTASAVTDPRQALVVSLANPSCDRADPEAFLANLRHARDDYLHIHRARLVNDVDSGILAPANFVLMAWKRTNTRLLSITGQMRMFPLADIEGCAVGEIISPSSVKLNVKARTIPGQLENPLEVASPVEIEFSGSANGVARFIIGYDATPGLTIDRVWYRYNV